MIKLLMIIFIIRPIIDLFWEFNLGPINIAGVIALLLSLLLYLLFFPGVSKKKVYINKITLLFIVYCTVITICTFKNISDLDNLFRIISATIFLFIVSKNISGEQLEKMMKYFIIVTLIPIIISYLQAAGIVEYSYWDYLVSGRIGRATGGYRQPSVLTRLLTFSNLYCLYFLSRYKENIKIKKYCRIYLLLSCLSIFLSYHRTGYYINTFIIISWIIIDNKRNIPKLTIKSFLVVAAVIVTLSLVNYFGLISITIDDFNKLTSIESFLKFENGKLNLTLRGRGGLIEQLLYYMSNSSWYYSVLGNGISNNYSTGFNFIVADMDWIRIVWNYGVIGLFIWMLQYRSFILILLNKKTEYINKYIKRVGVYSIIIYLFFGFTIEATTTPNFMYHVYLIIGYIACNTLKVNKKSYQERGIKND